MAAVSRDTVLAKVQTAVLQQTGVADPTLAEYILSLGKDGSAKLRTELAEFPAAFVDTIVALVEPFYLPSRHELCLNDSYNVVVKKVVPFGAFVKVLEPRGPVPSEGLIHVSEFGDSPKPRPGDRLSAQLTKIDGNRLSFSLRRRRVFNPDDAFEAQQLAASGLSIDQPHISDDAVAAHNRDIDVVHYVKVPGFLRNESLSTSMASNASELRSEQSEMSETASHTARVVPDARPSLPASPGPTSPGHASTVSTDLRSKSLVSIGKPDLPVHSFKSQIVEAVAKNPVVIIVGDTGSGKTTQIVQYLHAAGLAGENKVIACTQPRRIAAISIAQRVATEMRAKPVGGLVGYAVRFDDNSSQDTRIKYMTDGLLQSEAAADQDLTGYSVIMLDEAHERTVATDVLFALLKKAITRRPDLHVIVTSATLDAERFSAYFGEAPVLRIPGRTFPVTIRWLPEPVLDYMEAALSTVKRIHEQEDPGDILVFLTGQAEIDLAAASIPKLVSDGSLIAVPVYAALPSEQQQYIFEPAPEGKRKVVIATNIAETSLTIDGILYVVDPGFAKVQVWDPRQGMDVLKVVPISQAQANQRSGRAGRTAPGICYRLYTEHAFSHEMSKSTVPDIQRQNLGSLALQLKSMGISDLLNVDFLDPPPRQALVSSLRDLYLLGALDDEGELTTLGRKMASYPIEPAMARALLTAMEFGDRCTEDLITIVAMMTMPSVYYRPSNPPSLQAEADRMHRRLQDYSGDHLTLLNTYSRWVEAKYSRKWCEDNFLHFRTLLKVRDARKQITNLVSRGGNRRSGGSDDRKYRNDNTKDAVLKALCAGYFHNIAKADGNSYKLLADELQVSIHPSSVLFRRRADYVLYNSLVLTSREYIHTVSQIRSEWLLEMAPGFFRIPSGEDIRKRRRKETLAPLFNKRATHPDEWRISTLEKNRFPSRRGRGG